MPGPARYRLPGRRKRSSHRAGTLVDGGRECGRDRRGVREPPPPHPANRAFPRRYRREPGPKALAVTDFRQLGIDWVAAWANSAARTVWNTIRRLCLPAADPQVCISFLRKECRFSASKNLGMRDNHTRLMTRVRCLLVGIAACAFSDRTGRGIRPIASGISRLPCKAFV
jgi:hypothetical protein